MVGALASSPYLYVILLLIGSVGVLLEILFLKKGLFLLAGVVAFGLYFVLQFTGGSAEYTDLILFGVGVIFLLLELIVVSFGILGIVGGLCVFTGVIQAAPNPTEALYAAIVAVVLAVGIVLIVLKKFARSSSWQRFILKEQLTTEEGYISAPDQRFRLAQRGVALTPLRPAGTASIDGTRVDVVTQGEFIASGSQIEVIQVEGVRVVVQLVKENK
ncbi:nodulation efficiency protein NfeD [Paenibacillus sp. N1-5-1-14]|uniref:NfeD family protein n=1 Tax=Paenibacillus radicibacter TaxID=2972488 RepID=UPI0021596D01|nr:NfeD family protein [Paenibacillus radicibacter]MCR8641982.1 nodulation efficiency protein NfeD [Paenibacillus radicibacter]